MAADPTSTVAWYMTTGDWNDTNSTGTEYVTKNPKLYKAYNVTLAVTTSFIMFSMGCGVNWKVIKPVLKRPIGPIIGMVCQLILLPLLCFCFALAFKWDGELAIGMIIMASSPGGAVSNIYTFWSRGDLPLSVTMTTFSTTLALGFVPLNMFIYTIPFTDESITIPYLEMFLTVLYTWVAAAVGVSVGWKLPKAGFYISRVGSVVGMLLIILSGIFQAKLYPEVFDLPWSVWFLGMLIPVLAFGMGNAGGFIFKMSPKQAKTIGFETGMQNAAVALTMIAISYDEQEAGLYVQYPLLYSTWMIIEGFIIVVIYRFYYRTLERRWICQIKKDQRCKDLARLEDFSDTASVDSATSAASAKTSKDPVNMGKGKFKIVDEEFRGNMNHALDGDMTQAEAKAAEALGGKDGDGQTGSDRNSTGEAPTSDRSNGESSSSSSGSGDHSAKTDEEEPISKHALGLDTKEILETVPNTDKAIEAEQEQDPKAEPKPAEDYDPPDYEDATNM